jgi:hypothetical protein
MPTENSSELGWASEPKIKKATTKPTATSASRCPVESLRSDVGADVISDINSPKTISIWYSIRCETAVNVTSEARTAVLSNHTGVHPAKA